MDILTGILIILLCGSIAAKNNNPQVVCRYSLTHYEVDEFRLQDEEL